MRQSYLDDPRDYGVFHGRIYWSSWVRDSFGHVRSNMSIYGNSNSSRQVGGILTSFRDTNLLKVSGYRLHVSVKKSLSLYCFSITKIKTQFNIFHTFDIILTLASRGYYLVFLALSVKVVVQEHLFVDHFKGNLQLHFSLNVPSKFSISHALFKHPQ